MLGPGGRTRASRNKFVRKSLINVTLELPGGENQTSKVNLVKSNSFFLSLKLELYLGYSKPRQAEFILNSTHLPNGTTSASCGVPPPQIETLKRVKRRRRRKAEGQIPFGKNRPRPFLEEDDPFLRCLNRFLKGFLQNAKDV